MGPKLATLGERPEGNSKPEDSTGENAKQETSEEMPLELICSRKNLTKRKFWPSVSFKLRYAFSQLKFGHIPSTPQIFWITSPLEAESVSALFTSLSLVGTKFP